MNEMKLGIVESHFADIVWEREPIASGELVEICKKELGWKKSTTYTVLKKLCEKGILKNEEHVVSSVISKEDYYAIQSEQFVEENFKGTLPAFIAAWTRRKKLTAKEIAEIRRMIDEYEGD
jgi:predicted transcriptional regulator